MTQAYNFSAGPAMLPHSVLLKIQEELIEYENSKASVMEISHRGVDFMEAAQKSEKDLRLLMKIPDNYKVLFLQGGASTQFLMVAMNLLENKAAYTNTGTWAKKAIKEAKAFGTVDVLGSSEDENFSYIPKNYTISSDYDYFHCTSNNTISGTQMQSFPECPVPLVCDMSSDIFSRELDFSKFDLIYAGAQKNMGPAGTTLVVVKKSILGKVSRYIPTMLDYTTHIDKDSMFNTPSVFAVYGCLQTLKWIDKQGLASIEKLNTQKADLLYNEIDANDLFVGTTAVEDRSKMNVTFLLKDESKNEAFLAACAAANISGIKGHRSVGGFRASMYNALGLDSVQVLVDVIKKFK